MATKTKKSLTYRRAVWLESGDFESLLRQAHDKLKTVAARTLSRPGGQKLRSLRRKLDKPAGLFLHIAAETPGDSASVLARLADDVEEADVGTAPPPRGKEFMDGDIFAYIRRNDVCLCSTGLRDRSLKVIADELFRKAKLGAKATQYELQPIANVEKVKLIEAQGVKEIDLGASLYEATTKYIKRKVGAGALLGGVARQFKSTFGSGDAPKYENLVVGLTIRADRRTKRGRSLGTTQLDEIAEDLVETDDQYVIVTTKGQKITQNEVYVTEQVEMGRHGKSVDRDEAWAKLRAFYASLQESGAVAQ